MGWSIISDVKRPNVAYIGKLFEQDNSDRKVSLVDGAIVKLKEFYGILEELDKKTGNTRRFPVVALVSMCRDRSFGIKELSLMDMTGCPRRILDALGRSANRDKDTCIDEWVNTCELRINARSSLPKVGRGAIFEFLTPLQLVGGANISCARVEEVVGQRVIMVGVECSTRFRISMQNLKNRLQNGSAGPMLWNSSNKTSKEVESDGDHQNKVNQNRARPKH